jgi:hypothetical protein
MVKTLNKVLETVVKGGNAKVPETSASGEKVSKQVKKVRYDTSMTNPKKQPKMKIRSRIAKGFKIPREGGLSHNRVQSKNRFSSVGAPRRRGDGGLISSQKKGPFKDNFQLDYEPNKEFIT